MQKEFRKKPCTYWKELVDEAGFGKEVQVIKRIKVKKLLHEDLNQDFPLFRYKDHHVFGEVLVVDSPVQMSQTPVKDICPAHYFGMDTEKYLDRSGIDSETLRKKLVAPVKPVEKVNALLRMKWFLGQMKLIAAFVYKKS